ncbi:hypothetical protein HOK51_09900 [Candidatus Woesearchaeota archaeon]|mgnify:CR=1 FL=1|jgi:uncharacterized protein (UPF0147 family)|nr:hypothetical protein [Candidatus Woesearchaeota archaeon]MBT6520136.1 hypothetical protein [Candidatus Woesearchaeota archaeon]MBT7366741.1 hypothetical protein [Candidatus Woesearchaeota archaeon]
MEDNRIKNIISALDDLNEDSTVPKNIRARVKNIIGILKEETDVQIRINRALQELDEISEDTNMQSYTRTQIWNIASLLEMI